MQNYRNTEINPKIKNYFSIKTILLVITTSIISSYAAFNFAQNKYLNPISLMRILIIILIFFLLGIIYKNNITKNFIAQFIKSPINLRKKIIIAFSIVTIIPSFIITFFSVYFFDFGLKIWFDDKVSNILNQSITVAEAYIKEHKLQLKEAALSMADDLNEVFYYLVHNPELFMRQINAEAELRSLNEVIVFQKNTNTILAQTAFSFALSFVSIPKYLMEKADRGEVVEIDISDFKIRMLVKLPGEHDTYLLISKLIDDEIINHVKQTNNAANEYYNFKNHMAGLEIKFLIIFCLLNLILLLSIISWSIKFAGNILIPINNLVNATQEVEKGNLLIKVALPETKNHQDETYILTLAFNKMVKQINNQQRDLVVAQRALAWSDVARKVAHEIKNPLTPIHLSANILASKFKDQVKEKEVFLKYVNTINKYVEDINKIVVEFSNFARMPKPVLLKCDFLQLIEEIINSRKLLNEQISYSLYSKLSSILLDCDSAQINQAMVNIIKNAEEALSEKDDNFNKKIEIYISQENKKHIQISIIDNGNGFSSDLVGKAREGYITTKTKGMGLGIAITKKIIEDHAGSIELTNEENKGARINILLPYKG